MPIRALSVVLLLACLATPVSAADHPVLPLKSLGIANRKTQPAGRRINDLAKFDGKLFVGTGDYSVNTGPMDILALDPETGKIAIEGEVQDEAIAVFRVVSGRLVIPGPDATDSWELGNVYVRADDGTWTMHRSVPHGIHVHDVAAFGGRWWVATGSFVEPVEGQGIGCGAVLSSGDEGKTWQFDLLSRADRRGFARYGWLAVFRDRLYAFSYALVESPSGMVFVPDPMGDADALVTDGGPWRPVDLVPAPDVIKASPIVFGDRMLLSVVTGRAVPGYADTVQENRGLPEGAAAHLFAFDGEKTAVIDFPHDFLVDAAIGGDRLFLLYLKDGKYLLASTKDLKDWSVCEPAVGNGHPLSIQYFRGGWYFGMKDGNLLVSTGLPEESDVAEPESYEILADLPRDGRGAWAALVSNADPSKSARLFVRRDGPRIEAETTNVAEFVVFAGDLGISGGATLAIRGGREFPVTVGPDVAIVAKRGENAWTVTTTEGTAATYLPEPRVVATATVALTRAGDDPTIGLVVADAIRAAARADVALVNRGTVRRDVPAGPIHAADVADLVYRNRIATFRVRGEVLREMIAHSIATGGRDRCQFSGLEVVWSEEDGLVGCSLRMDEEYLVASPDYTAEHGEKYFGRVVEFAVSDTYVHEALRAHLARLGEVGAIPPRLTRTE
jgi:hypothetical protein